MAGLADWLEDYRNWRGRQDWEQGKGWQDFFGGDPRAQEQFEKLSGFGTDAGGLVGMIKASHGSPHAFTKFDLSKIGTGEGAQAYGHGMYFGQGFDSPVAKEYQKVLSEKGGWDVGSIPGLDVSPNWTNLSDRNRAEVTAAYFNKGDSGAKAKLKELAFWQKDEPDEKSLQSLLKNFDALHKPLGHLYNVELKWPDAAREASDPLGEHHLLDWDAPLSEQPNQIQKHLIDMAQDIDLPIDYWHPSASNSKNLTGEDLYNALQMKLSGKKGLGDPKEASVELNAWGIPGIRYLDQASRGAGSGTRNYVIFDQDIPNIVSRNGVSLSDLLRR